MLDSPKLQKKLYADIILEDLSVPMPPAPKPQAAASASGGSTSRSHIGRSTSRQPLNSSPSKKAPEKPPQLPLPSPEYLRPGTTLAKVASPGPDSSPELRQELLTLLPRVAQQQCWINIARAQLLKGFRPNKERGWFGFGKEAYSDFQLARFPQLAELLVKQLEQSIEAARRELHTSLATAITHRLQLDWDSQHATIGRVLDADMVSIISRSVVSSVKAALTLPPGFVLKDTEDYCATRTSTEAELKQLQAALTSLAKLLQQLGKAAGQL